MFSGHSGYASVPQWMFLPCPVVPTVECFIIIGNCLVNFVVRYNNLEILFYCLELLAPTLIKGKNKSYKLTGGNLFVVY